MQYFTANAAACLFLNELNYKSTIIIYYTEYWFETTPAEGRTCIAVLSRDEALLFFRPYRHPFDPCYTHLCSQAAVTEDG